MTDRRQEYEDAIKERNNLIAEVQQLRAVNQLLRAALQQVEWIQDYEDGDWYCSGCDMNKLIGHDDSCELKLALDAARPWAAKPATGA